MRVGIAGVGGIGSNVAVNLVRSGIKELTLVDFDRVEASNLNRQFYFLDQVGGLKADMLRENLLRICPDLKITTMSARLTDRNLTSCFSDCSVIVEGFDRAEEKKMLLEVFAGDSRTVVSASGIAGCRVDTITTRTYGNCSIVGDFVSDCDREKLYAHKVLAVAAFMTEKILAECGCYE